MGEFALVFPGQGSQCTGMGKNLYDNFPLAKKIFDKADEVLGFSLKDIIFSGDEETLKQTEIAQPAILTVSIAALSVARERGLEGEKFVAGHSLGEYSALVAAGVLEFEDVLRIVRRRGELMRDAGRRSPGTMCAVLGLGRDTIEDVCRNLEGVWIANINCPGQIVISGERESVEEAARLLKDAGAKRCVMLQVSGAFHTSLMKGAAEEFASFLDGFSFGDARVPVVANVTASPVKEGEKIKELLIAQIYSPVLWEDSVSCMIGQGVNQCLL